MELKYILRSGIFCTSLSSNRTFMELKLTSLIHMYAKMPVLIEISATQVAPDIGSSSNRTFMELKFWIKSLASYKGFCSNRTFMELKLGKVCLKAIVSDSSNRTFMELK